MLVKITTVVVEKMPDDLDFEEFVKDMADMNTVIEKSDDEIISSTCLVEKV